MELPELKRSLLKESLLVGLLTGLDAFMFIAFSRAAFGNSEKPIMVLFLALAGFMVANISRKIRHLGRPESAVEENLRLQKELQFIVKVKWVLLALLPALSIAAVVLQNQKS